MISLLHLRNFKCFEDQKISFKPLTLLTGLNGMGKSSVIQSLLLLRQSLTQGNLQQTPLVLNGEFVRIGTGQDALYQAAETEEISFNLETSDGVSGEWVWGYDKVADFLPYKESKFSNEELMKSATLFSSEFRYLSAERIGPRTSFSTSYSIVRQHKQVGIQGEYAVHYLELFRDEPVKNEAVLHPQVKSNKLLAQVEAWMGEISPGTRLSVTPHTEMDLVGLRYRFLGDKVSSNEFRSTNVGFGLTYTLPVIVAILSAEPGSIVILENPEAHLHPRGQASMGRLLALASSGGVQVIAETHSDHVLNGIRICVHQNRIHHDQVGLRYFDRSLAKNSFRARVISPKMDDHGRLDCWPDGFFDEWEKSLDALLEPKGE